MKSGLRKLLCWAVGLAALSACEQTPSEPPSLDSPSLAIVDGRHSGGNPRFFFLPPVVADPQATGVFDSTQSPVVEICELATSSCALPLIATYTMSSGPGGETVKLQTDHYSLKWRTDQFVLDTAKVYRITVRANGYRLGYADVELVNGGRDLKNVDNGNYIGLVDGHLLSLKFRIETGIFPVQLAIVSGDGQIGAPGVTLPSPAVVVLTDNSGFPLEGEPIAFVPSAGSVSSPVAVTDPTGKASTSWTLGALEGLQALQASSGPASVTFSATADSWTCSTLVSNNVMNQGTYHLEPIQGFLIPEAPIAVRMDVTVFSTAGVQVLWRYGSLNNAGQAYVFNGVLNGDWRHGIPSGAGTQPGGSELSTPFSAGRHTVEIRYDGYLEEMLVDGAVAASARGVVPLTAWNGDIWIARNGGTSATPDPLGGIVHEVKVCKRPAPTPTPGLVGYYPLDGIPTFYPIAPDASGHDNHGLPFGTAATSDRAGNPKTALSFNGVTDSLRIPAAVTNGLASGSITFWLRTADDAVQYNIFAKIDQPGVPVPGCIAPVPLNGYTLRAQFGGGPPIDRWYFFVNRTDAQLWTPVMPGFSFSSWHHYAFTWGPGGRSIFLDGVEIAASPETASTPTVGDLIFSPQSCPRNEMLKGALDEIRIYNRTLSALEVAALAQ